MNLWECYLLSQIEPVRLDFMKCYFPSQTESPRIN